MDDITQSDKLLYPPNSQLKERVRMKSASESFVKVRAVLTIQVFESMYFLIKLFLIVIVFIVPRLASSEYRTGLQGFRTGQQMHGAGKIECLSVPTARRRGATSTEHHARSNQ